MKQQLHFSFFIVLLYVWSSSNVLAQCADPANIYSFTYDDRGYEVVKEGKIWVDAAACAAERGGYLVEINDATEQSVVYGQLGRAGIVNDSTIASDGGEAAYVWLGGNDLKTEGTWVWDGRNDDTGTTFWMGKTDGSAVGDAYTNWGNEPDNYAGQDGLGIALTQWPINTGSLGFASQWNDVDEKNELYFVIEYDYALGLEDRKFSPRWQVYPNPTSGALMIEGLDQQRLSQITLQNVTGQVLQTVEVNQQASYSIDLGNYTSGIYFVELLLDNGEVMVKKVVKE